MEIDPNKTIIEPVIPEEEWPERQLCSYCQKPADKKITTYGNPDGLLRIARYCNHCIETEFPQFKINRFQARPDQARTFQK